MRFRFTVSARYVSLMSCASRTLSSAPGWLSEELAMVPWLAPKDSDDAAFRCKLSDKELLLRHTGLLLCSSTLAKCCLEVRWPCRPCAVRKCKPHSWQCHGVANFGGVIGCACTMRPGSRVRRRRNGNMPCAAIPPHCVGHGDGGQGPRPARHGQSHRNTKHTCRKDTHESEGL